MKYKIKSTVISVYVGGVVRPTSSEKKANVVFDTEKDSFKNDDSKAELEAAYKAGFLVKQIGKEFVAYEDESKKNAKELEAKKAKGRGLSTKLGGLRKELKKLEGDLEQSDDKEAKAKIQKDIDAKTSEIEGVENDIKELK